MGRVCTGGAFTGAGVYFQILGVTQMFMDISYLLAAVVCRVF